MFGIFVRKVIKNVQIVFTRPFHLNVSIDSLVVQCCWSLSSVSIRYKSIFPPKVSPIFKSIFMWHVIFWYPGGISEVSLPFVKLWADALHLFENCIPPECVAIILIKCICLCNRFGYLQYKVLIVHPVLRFDLTNDSIEFY